MRESTGARKKRFNRKKMIGASLSYLLLLSRNIWARNQKEGKIIQRNNRVKKRNNTFNICIKRAHKPPKLLIFFVGFLFCFQQWIIHAIVKGRRLRTRHTKEAGRSRTHEYILVTTQSSYENSSTCVWIAVFFSSLPKFSITRLIDTFLFFVAYLFFSRRWDGCGRGGDELGLLYTDICTPDGPTQLYIGPKEKHNNQER